MRKSHKDPIKEQVKKLTIYHDVFKHNESGQRVLKDMMKQHFFMSSSFDQNPYEMARKEGERNVVLRILTNLNMNPQDLIKIIEEANNEE